VQNVNQQVIKIAVAEDVIISYCVYTVVI